MSVLPFTHLHDILKDWQCILRLAVVFPFIVLSILRTATGLGQAMEVPSYSAEFRLAHIELCSFRKWLVMASDELPWLQPDVIEKICGRSKNGSPRDSFVLELGVALGLLAWRVNL